MGWFKKSAPQPAERNAAIEAHIVYAANRAFHDAKLAAWERHGKRLEAICLITPEPQKDAAIQAERDRYDREVEALANKHFG